MTLSEQIKDKLPEIGGIALALEQDEPEAMQQLRRRLGLPDHSDTVELLQKLIDGEIKRRIDGAEYLKPDGVSPSAKPLLDEVRRLDMDKLTAYDKALKAMDRAKPGTYITAALTMAEENTDTLEEELRGLPRIYHPIGEVARAPYLLVIDVVRYLLIERRKNGSQTPNLDSMVCTGETEECKRFIDTISQALAELPTGAIAALPHTKGYYGELQQAWLEREAMHEWVAAVRPCTREADWRQLITAGKLEGMREPWRETQEKEFARAVDEAGGWGHLADRLAMAEPLQKWMNAPGEAYELRYRERIAKTIDQARLQGWLHMIDGDRGLSGKQTQESRESDDALMEVYQGEIEVSNSARQEREERALAEEAQRTRPVAAKLPQGLREAVAPNAKPSRISIAGAVPQGRAGQKPPIIIPKQAPNGARAQAQAQRKVDVRAAPPPKRGGNVGGIGQRPPAAGRAAGEQRGSRPSNLPSLFGKPQ
jgi:hypothetical protein